MPVMPVMTFIMPRNRELKQLMQFVFDKITIPPYDMIEASDILEHIASECNKLLTTVSPKMGGVTLEQFKQIINELIIGLTGHELAVIILENNFSMFIAAELQQQRLETLNLTNNPAVAHLKLTNKELSNLSPSEKRKRSELLYALKQIEVDGLPSVIERVIEHKTYT